MSETRHTLREATRTVATAARRNLGAHASPAQLLAYHAGKLSGSEEARLQDHLALCPECTDAVLDLAAFPQIEPRGGAAGSMAERVPPWPAIRDRLEESLEHEAQRGPEPVAADRWVPGRLWLAVAAGLVISLGLSYRVMVLEERLDLAIAARGDLPLYTLIAEEGSHPTRGEERIEAGNGLFNLMLFVTDPGAYPKYFLEAIASDPPAEEVWTLRQLKPTREGLFLVVGLSARELPAGAFRLRLYGQGPSGPELLAEYPVLIEYR